MVWWGRYRQRHISLLHDTKLPKIEISGLFTTVEPVYDGRHGTTIFWGHYGHVLLCTARFTQDRVKSSGHNEKVAAFYL